MDELLGFDELPHPIKELIADTGVSNELSDGELVRLILESEEFNTYSSYKNPGEVEAVRKMTIAHTMRSRKDKNR